MAVYLVSYDLRNPGRNYAPLWARLVDWKAQRALESLWLMDTAASAVTIRDDLKQYIDLNDRILITKLAGETAWTTLQAGASEWLHAHFPTT